MILKEPDDKTRDIESLESLKSHPGADVRVRRQIEDQIRNIRAGAAGEAVAAYELKVHFGSGVNWIVIHDLRLEHDGLATQIDHLLINRFMEISVCESKAFANGVSIDEHGEFTTFYDRRPHGVPSPIEQNRRHVLLLERLLKSGAITLPKRLGMTIKPRINSFVLVARGSIKRPKTSFAGLETVIKSDQLVTRIQGNLEDVNPLLLAKIIGADPLADIGRQFVQLHRPIAFDWAARFGLTPLPPPMESRVAIAPPTVEVEQTPKSAPNSASNSAPKATRSSGKNCSKCAGPVSRGVASYCSSNAERFNGAIYCMPCQEEVLP